MANIGTLVEYVAYADPSITGKRTYLSEDVLNFQTAGGIIEQLNGLKITLDISDNELMERK